MDKHFNCKEQHFIGYQTHAELYLTQGKMALIDLSDLQECLKHKWSVYFDGFNWYAITNRKRGCGKPRTLQLHRFLMNPPDGMEIDHLNHNSLDNRRSNLKICNHADNTANKRKFKTNTSGVTGVVRHGDWWVAQICRNYKTKSRYFSTKDEAIKHRQEMECVS